MGGFDSRHQLRWRKSGFEGIICSFSNIELILYTRSVTITLNVGSKFDVGIFFVLWIMYSEIQEIKAVNFVGTPDFNFCISLFIIYKMAQHGKAVILNETKATISKMLVSGTLISYCCSTAAQEIISSYQFTYTISSREQ